jgi:hypothetical protein
MLELLLQREPTDEGHTFGLLSLVEGGVLCQTLEDAVRAVKVPRETAIPPGRYRVRLTLSQRFQVVLPILEDVPGFSGVRIHSGNTIEDTEGCILVGRRRVASGLSQSRIALHDVMVRMTQADAAGEDIWITITNPPG